MKVLHYRYATLPSTWYPRMGTIHRPQPYQDCALPLSYSGVKLGRSCRNRTHILAFEARYPIRWTKDRNIWCQLPGSNQVPRFFKPPQWPHLLSWLGVSDRYRSGTTAFTEQGAGHYTTDTIGRGYKIRTCSNRVKVCGAAVTLIPNKNHIETHYTDIGHGLCGTISVFLYGWSTRIRTEVLHLKRVML